MDNLRRLKRRAVFIYGPTAVGKSDFALALAKEIDGVIINMDIGSFYSRLNIGVAKPVYHQEKITHYLFDILDDPINFSVAHYRIRAMKLLSTLSHAQVPIFVGGSGFYLRSLLFPPTAPSSQRCFEGPIKRLSNEESAKLWLQLKDIDWVRASQIHPHDAVRVSRALNIYYGSGIRPSTISIDYNPIVPRGLLVYLDSAREVLYSRINDRVHTMIKEGLEHEAYSLYEDQSWRDFLSAKNLIGYKPLFEYFSKNTSLDDAIKTIQTQTRHYAKRQACFWRMLQKMLQAVTTKFQIMSFNVETCNGESMVECARACMREK